MTANISPVGNSQFIDVNGNPLSGGKLYTYEAGTTTPLAAYTTAEGDVPQPNPVILNSLGTLDDPLYLANGVAYKIIVKTSAGVSLGLEYDDIYGVAAADTTADEWLEFTGTFTYVSSTSFTVSGDQTSIFQVSRKLKTQNTAGIAYSNIASATYSAPDTTVTVTNTFLTLDSGLSQIWYGFLEPTHSSIPETTIGTAVRVGTQVEAQDALGVYSETETDDAIDAAIAAIPSASVFNPVINGDFAVDQEFAGASVTVTSGAALKYVIDGWYAWCTGANVTFQTTTVAGRKRARFTGAASNTLVGFATRMESINTADFASKFATISALLSSSSITTVNWGLYYANSTDAFGTVASPTRTTIDTGSFTITSTETAYSDITAAALASGATTGLELVFTIGALLGSQTFTIGDAQVEKGSVASPVFANISYADNLGRCQRYLYVVTAGMFTCGISTQMQAGINHQGMFATPSISASAAIVATQPAIGTYTQSSANATIDSNNANGGYYVFANFTGMTINVPLVMKSTGGKILLKANIP